MTALTLTDGTHDITPTLRFAFKTSTPSGATVHRLLTGGVALTRRPGNALRAGELELFYATAAAAETARSWLLKAAGPWTLSDPVTSIDGLKFHVVDDVESAQQKTALLRWVVTVGYQEIT